MSKKLCIRIFSGESVNIEQAPYHPYKAAVYAKDQVDSLLKSVSIRTRSYYTNNTDFVATLYHYVKCNCHPINVELYLNNNLIDDIGVLFEDWNRSLDFLSTITPDE